MISGLRQRRAPALLTYLASLFDDKLTPYFWWHCLGKTVSYDSSRAQRELGIEFTPFEQSVVETVESILAVRRPDFRGSFVSPP